MPKKSFPKRSFQVSEKTLTRSESESESESDLEEEDEDESSVVRINQPTTRNIEVTFLGHKFQIHQNPTILDHAAVLWDSALVLLAIIEESPQRKEALAGKRILELGGGTGFLSCALAKGLQCDVTCTDLPSAMENIRRNARDNYSPIRAMVYSWGDLEEKTLHELFFDEKAGEEMPFDFIIGTDVAYSETLNPLLIKSAAAIASKSNELFSTRWASQTLSQRGPSSPSVSSRKEPSCSIIFANELRCELAQSIFEKSALSCSLVMKQVSERKLPMQWRSKQMIVFDCKVSKASVSLL